MPVQLPNINQPFVDIETGLVNRTWYLALLSLNNSVPANVVVSVNLSGLNGITVVGGPITSAGVISLGIGNLTCANAIVAGTLTAANVVVSGTVTSANLRTVGIVATGTITAADVVASASILGANIRATATLTSVNVIATGTVTTANAIVTGKVTAVDVALSGVLRLGNAFTPGITGAAGWITVQDSAGTTYKILAQL